MEGAKVSYGMEHKMIFIYENGKMDLIFGCCINSSSSFKRGIFIFFRYDNIIASADDVKLNRKSFLIQFVYLVL